jgi:hypothetical protein
MTLDLQTWCVLRVRLATNFPFIATVAAAYEISQ